MLSAAAALSGCAFFFADTDGLAGGEAPADASPGDATTSNGDARLDPGTDGGSSPDASLPRCAVEKHTACIDWDKGSDLAPTSFVGYVDDGGTVAVLPGLATSPPNALRAAVPRIVTGSPNREARAVRQFPGFESAAHVELDVRLSPVAFEAGDRSLGFASFQIKSDGSNPPVYLTMTIQGVGISSSAVASIAPGHMPPLDTWVRFVVDQTTTSFTVTYDGETLTAAVPLTGPANGSWAIGLGPYQYNAPGPALDVRFDDVAIDLR